jgi:hypothetical protein
MNNSNMDDNAEIHRAALILSKMAASPNGAIGLKSAEGKEEMIDRPMVLQVSHSHKVHTLFLLIY